LSVDLERAKEFLLLNARLLDRVLFECRFEGGSPEAVVHALRAYQNDDGGFGNALEPDLRGPDSMPIHVDMAFRVLYEAGAVAPEMLGRACSYLESVSGPEGGVPGITPAALEYPRAPHWNLEDWNNRTLNPTAMLAGLLHGMHVANSWLDRADPFCWQRLSEVTIEDGPQLVAVFSFLNHAPDRKRAVQVTEHVANFIPDAQWFTLEPPTGNDYAHTPIDLAPWPDAMASGLFAPDLLDAHLDHLEAEQQEDGGWPITWEPPGDAAVLEWRGRWTMEALLKLQNYGRI
jgi:hypothetical protein